MMAHSISDMENYFSELEDFITLSDNDKVHLFHSSMLEILILKVNCLKTKPVLEFHVKHFN